MAVDWIKMRTDLYRDPKVCIIADQLLDEKGELARYTNQMSQRNMNVTRNVMRNAVIGGLLSVWGVMRHRGKRKNNDLVCEQVSTGVIDDIADLLGLGDALVMVGWVTETDSGVVFERFFEDYNCEPAQASASSGADRQRKYREKMRQKSDVTRDVTRDVTVTTEKRREDKRIRTPLPPTGESPDGEESQKPCSKAKPAIDYQAVADAYNEILGARLPQVTGLNDKRKRQIKALQPQLNDPSLAGWRTYFEAFNEEAKPFYFGDNNRGWQASFDYLLRSDTLIKIREGSL